MNSLNEMLEARFGISPAEIREVQGGWSAKAYRVDAREGRYFLKAYDKSLPSVRPWIERIDSTVSVLSRLSGIPELRRSILRSIPTSEGACKTETDSHVYVLYDYIEGETPGEKGLTEAQATELAGILARLHTLGGEMICVPEPAEDLSLPFCTNLNHYLDGADNSNELSNLLKKHADMLRAAIAETLELRDSVRLCEKKLVLCHTDAHPFNVIQSDRLVLVDWEDLRWSPAEADLILYAQSPVWKAFWKAYLAARPDFCINAGMMRFYLIRRRLDDIWSDVARITLEEPDKEETERMFVWINRALSEIERLLLEG